MKRLLLLTVSILLLFTACSPVQNSLSDREEPDYETLGYEKLKDGVYVDYDRSKFENAAAPKRYYAEYVTFEDEDMIPFFSEPPEIYTVMEHETFPVRRFENDIESGYYTPLGSMHFSKECWSDFSTVFSYYWANRIDTSVKELDFMTLSEVRERFADDAHRFVTDFRIYDLYAINAEDFVHVTTVCDPPFPDRGWSEPKDFYYIRARQYLDNIPVFAGVTRLSENSWYNGSEIEACYSADRTEEFSASGLYRILEEAPVPGSFISLSEAEQIIREQYEFPYYGYDQIILFDVDLVYRALNDENGRMILTPVWEFYEDIWADGISRNHYFTTPWIKIDAYTGEFLW